MDSAVGPTNTFKPGGEPNGHVLSQASQWVRISRPSGGTGVVWCPARATDMASGR